MDPPSYLLDKSFLVALADVDDPNHNEAKESYRSLIDDFVAQRRDLRRTDVEIEIGELAELVRKLVNPECRIVQLPALTEGDMTRRRPDNSRMVATLGRDLIPLEEGIRKTAEFQRSGGQSSADES